VRNNSSNVLANPNIADVLNPVEVILGVLLNAK